MMFSSGSFLKDELLKSSSGVYFTLSSKVLQVERMWPKYVATGGKKKKQKQEKSKVCTFHYDLCLSAEKSTDTNVCI